MVLLASFISFILLWNKFWKDGWRRTFQGWLGTGLGRIWICCWVKYTGSGGEFWWYEFVAISACLFILFCMCDAPRSHHNASLLYPVNRTECWVMPFWNRVFIFSLHHIYESNSGLVICVRCQTVRFLRHRHMSRCHISRARAPSPQAAVPACIPRESNGVPSNAILKHVFLTIKTYHILLLKTYQFLL